MSRLLGLLEVKTVEGEAIRMSGYAITPQSQSIILGRGSGGIIWNRPLGVIVEENGTQQRLPIIDVTRLVQIGLLVFGALCSTIGMISYIKRKDKTK